MGLPIIRPARTSHVGSAMAENSRLRERLADFHSSSTELSTTEALEKAQSELSTLRRSNEQLQASFRAAWEKVEATHTTQASRAELATGPSATITSRSTSPRRTAASTRCAARRTSWRARWTP